MIKNVLITISFLFLTVTQAHALSLTLTPKNISDDQDNYAVTFGSDPVAALYQTAGQYIELQIDRSKRINNLRIDIYTNNTQIQTGYQKAGLVKIPEPSARLPLAWTARKSAAPSIAAGNPSDPASGWLWMKDKNDEDIPDTPYDESWTSANSGGYTTVCFISSSGDMVVQGEKCDSTVLVYVEGVLDGVLPGEYDGTIWFDCYATIDTEPPTIAHVPPPSEVCCDNKIVIQAVSTDNDAVASVRCYYKIDNSTWQVSDMQLQGTQWAKTALFTIEPAQLRNVSTVSYALEASDGYQSVWWKSTADPCVLHVTDGVSFTQASSGKYMFEDGNPHDGCSYVSLPQGALSGPMRLGIKNRPVSKAPQRAMALGDEAMRPLVSYDFEPDELKFDKAIELTLLYYDLDQNGLVELPDGTPTSVKAKDLQLCWWDGFEWRPMGAKINTTDHTVTTVTNHFSLYGLFLRDDALADNHRPKEKIITPAFSGKNDIAFFDGLEGSEFKINIYDVNGRIVRTVVPPQLPQWDGKDENGAVVESGVYIYQFESVIAGHNKLLSGTIVVAK